jgi:hypothetical protein
VSPEQAPTKRRLLDRLPEVPDEAGMRFRVLYEVDETSGCWLWRGTLREGRGQFKADGKTVQDDRWSWERVNGAVPASSWLRHDCGSTECVNPAHLSPVEPRSIAGAHERAKTHCPKGHPYDEANTYVAPSGKRMCRTCRRQR